MRNDLDHDFPLHATKVKNLLRINVELPLPSLKIQLFHRQIGNSKVTGKFQLGFSNCFSAAFNFFGMYIILNPTYFNNFVNSETI